MCARISVSAVVSLDVGHAAVFLSQVQTELTLVSKTQLARVTLRTDDRHKHGYF